MFMQQNQEEKKNRILDLFIQNPTCSLTRLATKEKVSLTFIYKTLNQNLKDWKEIKRKRISINKANGGQDQFEEISSADQNEDSENDQDFGIKREPDLILDNRIKKYQKLKLVNYVDKINNSQQSMEGKMNSLQKTLPQQQEKFEAEDSTDQQRQAGSQFSRHWSIRQNNSNNHIQEDNQFRNHQFNTKSIIKQQKQQNSLDIITLKQATLIIESLQQRRFKFTHENGQLVVSGQSLLNAILQSDPTREIEVTTQAEPTVAINEDMDNQSEFSLNVKIEE